MAAAEKQDEEVKGTPTEKKAWYQRFITMKTFVLFFCINMMLITIVMSYIQGVLTQIEKQFGLSSQQIGVYTMAFSIAIMPTTLTLGYVGRNWNHARLVGIGSSLYVLSCLMHTLPHFIYGTKDFYERGMGNRSDTTHCDPSRPEDDCSDTNETMNQGPLIILFIAGLLRGFAQAPFYTLGFAYTYANADNPAQAAFLIGKLGIWNCAYRFPLVCQLSKHSLDLRLNSWGDHLLIPSHWQPAHI